METKDYWPENLADQEGGSTQLGRITPDLRGMMMNEEVELEDDVGAANSVPFQDISRHDDINQLGPSIQVEYPNPHGVLSLPPETSDATIYEDPSPQEQSLQNFREFLFGTKKSPTRGSWPDLFATSVNWMLLDFTFYLLGVNSSRLIPDIFSTPTLQGPYSALISNEWHTLVATSIGAVIGGAIAIKIMKHFSRKKIQMWSFLGLGVLFIVVGALYITLLGKNGSAVIVAVYVFCQMLFNIGKSS